MRIFWEPWKEICEFCFWRARSFGRVIRQVLAVPILLEYGVRGSSLRSAESRLNQQLQYDLRHAEKNRKLLGMVKLFAA